MTPNCVKPTKKYRQYKRRIEFAHHGQRRSGGITAGLSGLLGEPIKSASAVRKHAVVIGTPANSPLIAALNIQALASIG